MSTRANVGILNADGTVTAIYTHFDGYLSHHGPILKDHYTTEAKIRTLIGLGDLSSLTSLVGKKHDFESGEPLHKSWCNAYGRDRGEKNTQARTYASVDEYASKCENIPYLFREGKWHIFKFNAGQRTWVDVMDALKSVASEDD